jgi:hypothetical protein
MFRLAILAEKQPMVVVGLRPTKREDLVRIVERFS